VLSGFLIGGLPFREMDATGNFGIGRFLARRAPRLWPVLYLFLVAQLLLTDRPA
jgi:peptidoglycan/LPS O-acetylase OafA/YrhL